MSSILLKDRLSGAALRAARWSAAPAPLLLDRLPSLTDAMLVGLATLHFASTLIWLGNWGNESAARTALPVLAALVAMALYCRRSHWTIKWGQAAAVLLCIAGPLVLAGLFFSRVVDTSWDSMGYHFPAIIRLSEGWNPLYEVSDILWANRYPNGLWNLFAMVGEWVGSLQSARFLKLVFLMIAAVCLWRLLIRWMPRSRFTLIVCIITVLSPVVSAQLWTFYLDDVVFLLTLCVFCASIELLANPGWRPAMLFGAAFFLLVLSKLTGIYFALVAMLAALACGYSASVSGRYLRIAVPTGVALVLAVGLAGWRPFYTNVQAVGNPFLLGVAHPVNAQSPVNLVNLPRPLRFTVSLLASSGGNAGEASRLKPPFWITPREVYFMATPDTRSGGFGPFFSAALLLGLCLYGLCVQAAVNSRSQARVTKPPLVAAAVAVIVVGSCMVFPVNWWARLIPHAWLLPVIPVICCSAQGLHNGWPRALTYAILVLLVLNTSFALVGNGARTVVRWWDWRNDLASLGAANDTVGVYSPGGMDMQITLRYWLEQAHYPVRELGVDRCTGAVIVWRQVTLCRLHGAH